VAHAEGRLGADELRATEDAGILNALELQRQAGVDVYTDGEYRRAMWRSVLSDAVDGFTTDYVEMSARGSPSVPRSRFPIVGRRLRQTRRLAAHEIGFLQQHAPGPFKITMPSAVNFAHICYVPGVTDRVYPTRSDLLADLVTIIHGELEAVVSEGVPYVQLDAPRYTTHVDPRARQELRDRGVDPDAALDESIAADNACLAGIRGRGAIVAMHLCRGNGVRGTWFAEGGYDPIAEKLFGSLAVDRILLEFDTELAGSFEPLRFVPADRTVVLGLVTTREPQLEAREDLLRRIDAAARIVPLERLAISPQCGFASNAPTERLTRDYQLRKLELVASVARQVWGA
jgi:5-methyltetrahydropteroyltriglutamate--homocysteine methyltransferase